MATTWIQPIVVHVWQAIDYITNNKVDVLRDPDVLSNPYAEDIGNGLVEYHTISSSINCNVHSADAAFTRVRQMHGKDSNNLAYHVWQSFEEKCDPAIAHEIGREMANELFSDFQVVISTHTDKEHTHNHIVFNSVAVADGKKYNDCLESYAAIRKASDRLCRDYGLHVNEQTADFNLVRYVDKETGKTRFFEPTERKQAIREGEYSNANDYRNTRAYHDWNSERGTHQQTVVDDIERLVLDAVSFDDLLRKLSAEGYKISAHKKDGSYKQHVSYMAPTHKKPVRDTTLGITYTRVELEKRISELVQQNRDEERMLNEPVPATLTYNQEPDDEPAVKVSSEYDIPSAVREDTKKIQQELREQGRVSELQRQKKEWVPREQYLLNCIKENLNALNFVSENKYVSFSQLYNDAALLRKRQSEIEGELRKINAALKRASESVVLIGKLNETKESIERSSNNRQYRKYEEVAERGLMETYTKLLTSKGLDSDEKRELYLERFKKFHDAQEKLVAAYKDISVRLDNYHEVVSTLKRIDGNGLGRMRTDIEKYEEQIVDSKRKREQEQEESNKKKGKGIIR